VIPSVDALSALVAASGLPGSTLVRPDSKVDDSTFSALLAVCESERSTGLLVDSIRRGTILASDEQAEIAETSHREALIRCLRLEALLLDAVGQLEMAGVEARVLKGSATAHLDYPDPVLRTFIDVDLLVRSDNFDTASTVLVDAGFVRPVPEIRPGFDRRFGKGCTLRSPSGFEVDLHRTLTVGPFGLTVGLEDLWSESTPLQLGGRTLQALGREERLLHACYHSVLGDLRPRLVPRRDIAQLVLDPDIDAARVRALAEGWQAEAVIALGIRRAWEVLQLADETALTAWARRYEPDPRTMRTIANYQASHARYATQSWASLRALPDAGTKAAFVFSLAFPTDGALGGRRLSLLRRGARAIRGLGGLR
jgi:hypothetical protein